LESWSGGGRRRSAVLMAAPGGRDARSNTGGAGGSEAAAVGAAAAVRPELQGPRVERGGWLLDQVVGRSGSICWSVLLLSDRQGHTSQLFIYTIYVFIFFWEAYFATGSINFIRTYMRSPILYFFTLYTDHIGIARGIDCPN
jgi:hypothetical protein